MTLLDSKKMAEEFCKHHSIIPTQEEKLLIELAILEGSQQQLKKCINSLKEK